MICFGWLCVVVIEKLCLPAGLLSGGQFMAHRRGTTLIALLFTRGYIWVSALFSMWFYAFLFHSLMVTNITLLHHGVCVGVKSVTTGTSGLWVKGLNHQNRRTMNKELDLLCKNTLLHTLTYTHPHQDTSVKHMRGAQAKL